MRAAGLGIAVTLTSTETGRMMITANCKHIPGGIWGAAFSMLLDQSECSMVRQQVNLDFNLTLLSQTDYIVYQKHNMHAGVRCSTVVRVFTHGAMGRRIDPSWGGPIELFLVPASAP